MSNQGHRVEENSNYEEKRLGGITKWSQQCRATYPWVILGWVGEWRRWRWQSLHGRHVWWSTDCASPSPRNSVLSRQDQIQNEASATKKEVQGWTDKWKWIVEAVSHLLVWLQQKWFCDSSSLRWKAHFPHRMHWTVDQKRTEQLSIVPHLNRKFVMTSHLTKLNLNVLLAFCYTYVQIKS